YASAPLRRLLGRRAHPDRRASMSASPKSATKHAASDERRLRRRGRQPYVRAVPRDVVIQVEDTGLLIRLESLAARLVYARAYRGISRLELARRAGYSSDTTVRRYERRGAVAQPHAPVVHRFADALGCDRVWLQIGRGEPHWQEFER